jgi:hypothetical protein
MDRLGCGNNVIELSGSLYPWIETGTEGTFELKPETLAAWVPFENFDPHRF